MQVRNPTPYSHQTFQCIDPYIVSLLLDAVDIAVPGQPTLMHYLQHDPVPVHYATSNAPVVPEIPVVPVLIPIHHPPPPPQQQPVPVQPPPPQQVNGNNGHL